MNLSTEFDAKVWVKEWMETITKYPNVPFDEGAMLGWFANAIMSGYDNCRWTHKDVWIEIGFDGIVQDVYAFNPKEIDGFNFKSDTILLKRTLEY